jgi:hypothetical protein
MTRHDGHEINKLIGELMQLQEQWESDPDAFDWSLLKTLAKNGAQAYNEGAGPSFHSLAIDGVQHNEFHERVLEYSLQAGFDPFKLVKTGSGTTMTAVISHESLAEAALSNSSSARMRASLMERARARFEPFISEIRNGKPKFSDAELSRTAEACAESIPLNVLEQIAPGLVELRLAEKRGRRHSDV